MKMLKDEGVEAILLYSDRVRGEVCHQGTSARTTLFCQRPSVFGGFSAVTFGTVDDWSAEDEDEDSWPDLNVIDLRNRVRCHFNKLTRKLYPGKINYWYWL